MTPSGRDNARQDRADEDAADVHRLGEADHRAQCGGPEVPRHQQGPDRGPAGLADPVEDSERREAGERGVEHHGTSIATPKHAEVSGEDANPVHTVDEEKHQQAPCQRDGERRLQHDRDVVLGEAL